MKQLYFALLLLVMAACADNDGIGSLREENVIRFDFPQGNDPWDQEIAKIAEEWGMYIIYKDVDSTNLNRTTWTSPAYSAPIWTCTTPSGEEIQQYVELVKEWLLGNLDVNSATDKASLPVYLYLVNDFKDANPSSPTYGQHQQVFQEGLDFWCLSFTSEEIEAGLTPKMIHTMATAFVYPGIRDRITSGEYDIPAEFNMSDYETAVGLRYYSLEEFAADMMFPPGMESMAQMMYDMSVFAYEKDEDNAYLNRGFSSAIEDDFTERTGIGGNYGAPYWMPWIEDPMMGSIHPYPSQIPADIEDRVKEDFLNMIRLALTFTENDVRAKYPVDTDDPKEAAGYQMINEKYDIVTSYMLEEYDIDLKRYANILSEE